MTNNDSPLSEAPPPSSRRWRQRLGRRRLGAATVLLLGGVAVGSGVTAFTLGGRSATMVALQPAPIAAMQPWTAVAVKGQVADVFGSRFVIGDASGRALVDTGPDGDNTALVSSNETVTVQGRFERGALHAAAVTHADGRTDLLGPPGPGGPRGPLAWLDRHWQRLHWRHDA